MIVVKLNFSFLFVFLKTINSIFKLKYKYFGANRPHTVFVFKSFNRCVTPGAWQMATGDSEVPAIVCRLISKPRRGNCGG
jgi:hypothetical protein